MEKEFILINEYSTKSNIGIDFILALEDEGLVDLRKEVDGHYLPLEQVEQLEFFSRLYYDLSVNVPGIDIIHNLIHKIKDMEHEMNILQRKLGYHETIIDDFFEGV